jgi:predicted transcriptional regulator YdeE/uncharacterized protein YndB with AHSA1/START domain
MPKFTVSKFNLINAPIEKVFQTINDFNTWRSWSPWLVTEPDAEVVVAKGGKSYTWKGNRTGSGSMEITSESENQSVNIDLNFLKPWKSYAKTNFQLSEIAEGTKVTWNMASSLPFFMFWMKNQMVNMIGNDYTRGLTMLKEIVEEGDLKSSLDFQGVADYKGCKYVGITTTTLMKDMGTNMSADFAKMWEYFGDKMDLITDKPFSIYHKWEMGKGRAQYTVAAPVSAVPENIPDGFVHGEIPSTKVYTIRHVGKYDHLGNAWSALYGLTRSKEVKMKRGIHPFEVYVNDPTTSKPEELITDLKFAVKE